MTRATGGYYHTERPENSLSPSSRKIRRDPECLDKKRDEKR